MMKSQRARQRARRRRSRGPGGLGDAAPPLTFRGAGALAARWSVASRADLVMLGRAVRAGWIRDPQKRNAFVAAISAMLKSPLSHRHCLAVVRVVIAMDKADLAAIGISVR
jgi:hypothetical protein